MINSKKEERVNHESGTRGQGEGNPGKAVSVRTTKCRENASSPRRQLLSDCLKKQDVSLASLKGGLEIQ